MVLNLKILDKIFCLSLLKVEELTEMVKNRLGPAMEEILKI